MDDDVDVKARAELASIINSLEHAEARFELTSFDSPSQINQARERALDELRKALAAARLAAAAFENVPKPARH